jgi:hypothetical protein
MSKGEHEQEMIDAQQDVLDAEHEVGAGDLQRARHGVHHERRRRRREADDLRGSVAAFHAHEHIGHRRAETGDMNRAAGQTAGALNAPVFRKGAVDEGGTWLAQVGGAGRELHVEAEPEILASTRHLPKHVVSLRAGLLELEIGRPDLVGEQAAGEGGEQHEDQEDDCFFIYHLPLSAASLSLSVGRGRSMVTV